MDVDFKSQGDTLIATVQGRVDTVSAPAFEKALSTALEGDARLLVVDLSALSYISSAGLRVFLSLAKKLKAKGAGIRLAAAQGSVRKVFEVSGFFSLFNHFDTREAAIDEC